MECYVYVTRSKRRSLNVHPQRRVRTSAVCNFCIVDDRKLKRVGIVIGNRDISIKQIERHHIALEIVSSNELLYQPPSEASVEARIHPAILFMRMARRKFGMNDPVFCKNK